MNTCFCSNKVVKRHGRGPNCATQMITHSALGTLPDRTWHVARALLRAAQRQTEFQTFLWQVTQNTLKKSEETEKSEKMYMCPTLPSDFEAPRPPYKI